MSERDNTKKKYLDFGLSKFGNERGQSEIKWPAHGIA